MKKGLIFLKLFAVITLSLLLLDIFPYVYLKTDNNDVITKNFYVENSVKETANEDAVIATINYDEIVITKVQENGSKLSKIKVEATKKVVKEQPKVSKTVEQPKPEVKQESVESKFNLGTITISNSDFKRNVIMDDGSYYYLNIYKIIMKMKVSLEIIDILLLLMKDILISMKYSLYMFH